MQRPLEDLEISLLILWALKVYWLFSDSGVVVVQLVEPMSSNLVAWISAWIYNYLEYKCSCQLQLLSLMFKYSMECLGIKTYSLEACTILSVWIAYILSVKIQFVLLSYSLKTWFASSALNWVFAVNYYTRRKVEARNMLVRLTCCILTPQFCNQHVVSMFGYH